MEFNEKLKATREDNDISQDEVAKHLGVHRKQIGRWENGTNEMGVYKLKEMCLLYGVSADYLLGLPPGMAWPRENRKKG